MPTKRGKGSVTVAEGETGKKPKPTPDEHINTLNVMEVLVILKVVWTFDPSP